VPEAKPTASLIPSSSGKHTPRKPSPSLSGDEDENDEAKKVPLSKKRRSSKGWEDAGREVEAVGSKSSKSGKEGSGSEALAKSPRSSKPTAPNGGESTIKSPRSINDKVPEKSEKVDKPEKGPSAASQDAKANQVSVAPPITLPPSAVIKLKSPSPHPQVSRTPSPPAREPKDVKETQSRKPEIASRQSSASSTGTLAKQQQNTGATTGSAKPKMSNTVIAQEWVQCESCKKWRKLPLSISASSLPDTWVCAMNTWNAAMASCSALVEEGSEETTNDDGAGGDSNGGMGSGVATVGIPKRSALPPGINLYGGQVQPAALPFGPGGQKLPRVVSYRDLIGAHYRTNKNFNPGYNSACDTRYACFSSYASPSLKQRPFEQPLNCLARVFEGKTGSFTSVDDVVVSSPGRQLPSVGGSRLESLPPKKRYRFENSVV